MNGSAVSPFSRVGGRDEYRNDAASERSWSSHFPASIVLPTVSSIVIVVCLLLLFDNDDPSGKIAGMRGHQIFTRQFLWKHGHLEEKHPEAEQEAQADLTVSEVVDSDRSPPLTTSETSRTQGTMTTSETSETGASEVSTPAVLEDVLNAEASTSGLTIGASEDSERQKASKDPAEVPPPIEVQAEMPSADIPAKRPLDDASAAQNIEPELDKGPAVEGDDENEEEIVESDIPGFQKWLGFAKERKCHLGEYKQIKKDLGRFKDPEDPSRPGIRRAQIKKAQTLEALYTVTIKNGTASHNNVDPAWSIKAEEVMLQLSGFAHLLPDMEIVFNQQDEPRILPGNGTYTEKINGPLCDGASQDFHDNRLMHGFFSIRHEGGLCVYEPPIELLPVFSQTKINDCYQDITYPSSFNWDTLLTPEEEQQLLPWKERKEVMFFRGSNTGGTYEEPEIWNINHRHRLVRFAAGKPRFDIGFTWFAFCSRDELCVRQQQAYGIKEHVPAMENFRYKYLIAIDGFTLVGRTPKFLSSGSLVFKSGIFSDWYEQWLRPNVHYLPVTFDFSNLESQLDWAYRNDEEARKMAERGRKLAKRRLRNEDMNCYFYRLLLEYNALILD